MTVSEFYGSLLCAWIAFYVVAPVWLLFRRRILLAGLVQLLGAILPGLWHGFFWPDEAGSLGLLIAMLIPLPLLIAGTGLIAGLIRIDRWVQRENGKRDQ